LTGIFLRLITEPLGIEIPETRKILEIFGVIGLILIVLEGALELNLTRDKKNMILQSFSSAIVMLIIISLLLAWIFTYFLHTDFRTGLINAIPFAVISSTVAIASVKNLPAEKKEFIFYESTLSDILGIILFNFLVENTNVNFSSIMFLSMNLIILLIVSIVFSLLLAYFINHIKNHIKFFLVFSILILIYSTGKLLHLSTLILIMIFGLFINNFNLFLKGKLAKYFNSEQLGEEIKFLRSITSESAFVIRTLFFVLFGFSINIQNLLNTEVLLTGGLIFLAVILVRLIYLNYFAKVSLFPALFVAPRGLITILLFYSIPAQYIIKDISSEILFFVIIITGLFMMAGLFFSKNKGKAKAI
jgi:Kef-type K+ transport system membrane component KefB